MPSSRTGALGSVEAGGPAVSSGRLWHSGTGVALGSGLKASSRQPLNVSMLPSASTIGSFSSGSRFWYSCVEGARMNAIRSSIWT